MKTRIQTAGLLLAALSLTTPAFAADSPDTGVQLSTGVARGLAAVIALPFKAITCAVVVTTGGVAYGLTLGNGDFVSQELVSAIPGACGSDARQIGEGVNSSVAKAEGR